MRHIAFVSCRREGPATAHTTEEISKFIQGVLDLMGQAVDVFAGIQELQDLKQGTTQS
jgi:hypothetical protein